MLRIALALGFSIISLAGVNSNATADDKKEAKPTTLEGKLVCTKCKLSETDSYGNALQVTGKDKKVVTYYLKDKGKGEKYHKCSGEQAASVTGIVSKEDDKMVISKAKVTKK